MKFRWKHGETPLFPVKYRKLVLPECEGLSPGRLVGDHGWTHDGRAGK